MGLGGGGSCKSERGSRQFCALACRPSRC
jgi:hypothetical protein